MGMPLPGSARRPDPSREATAASDGAPIDPMAFPSKVSRRSAMRLILSACCAARVLLPAGAGDARPTVENAKLELRGGPVVRVGDHVSGEGDKTAVVQSLISGLSAGDELVFGPGVWRVDGTLTVAQDDITITIDRGAIINRSAGAPATTWLESTGARFHLRGAGEIVGPSSWDGTNVAWTFATILCRGHAPRIRGITLTNVHKVGIGFKEATGTATVEGVTIIGNYPSAQWTGVETVHFGITHDPSPAGSRLRAVDNVIKSCVQGICLGNFSSGTSSGTIMKGNYFEGCHNHALYNSRGFANAVFAKNTIVNCAQPVVMTGNGHTVAYNTMSATGTGNNLHTTCNIQMRDSSGGVVKGNRMIGDVWASSPGVDGAPAIDFFNLPSAGVNVVRDNVCIGNTIEISDTASAIGIRVGSANTVTNQNNVVAGNVIVGGGTTRSAAIVIAGNPATRQRFAEVTGNVIHLTKASSGIYVVAADQTRVAGNKVHLEAVSATAATLGGIRVGPTSSRTTAEGNTFVCRPTAGTNITFRGVYEDAGTTGNRFSHDKFEVDDTLLTAFVPHFLQSTSGVVLHERLPGAPAVVAAPGSTWRRTDGGPGSTFYIKESAAHLATWRAL